MMDCAHDQGHAGRTEQTYQRNREQLISILRNLRVVWFRFNSGKSLEAAVW